MISIVSDAAMLWPIATALCSPPLTAWAATQHLGAARSSSAIKLSASDVRALPLPEPSLAWEQAEEALRAGNVLEAGRLMCTAYGVEDTAFTWWRDGFPAAAEELDEERPEHRHAVGHEQVRRGGRSSSTDTKKASTTSPSSERERSVVAGDIHADDRPHVVILVAPSRSRGSARAADFLGEPRAPPLPLQPRVDDPADGRSQRPGHTSCHRLVGGSAPFRRAEHRDADRAVTEVPGAHQAARHDVDHVVVGIDDVDQGVAGIDHF